MFRLKLNYISDHWVCQKYAIQAVTSPPSVQLKARFVKCKCKDLQYDNSTLKYVTKLACQNPMSVSGRNVHDYVNFAHDISMIGMNVKQVYNFFFFFFKYLFLFVYTLFLPQPAKTDQQY